MQCWGGGLYRLQDTARDWKASQQRSDIARSVSDLNKTDGRRKSDQTTEPAPTEIVCIHELKRFCVGFGSCFLQRCTTGQSELRSLSDKQPQSLPSLSAPQPTRVASFFLLSLQASESQQRETSDVISAADCTVLLPRACLVNSQCSAETFFFSPLKALFCTHYKA